MAVIVGLFHGEGDEGLEEGTMAWAERGCRERYRWRTRVMVWGAAVSPEMGTVGVATGQCGEKRERTWGRGRQILFTFTVGRSRPAYQTLDKDERANIFLDYLLVCCFIT